jgi:acyl dehydratase
MAGPPRGEPYEPALGLVLAAANAVLATVAGFGAALLDPNWVHRIPLLLAALAAAELLAGGWLHAARRSPFGRLLVHGALVSVILALLAAGLAFR